MTVHANTQKAIEQKLWAGELTQQEIARKHKVSVTRISKMSAVLRRRNPEAWQERNSKIHLRRVARTTDGCDYTPTPETIANKCREIQSNWDNDTRWVRSGRLETPYELEITPGKLLGLVGCSYDGSWLFDPDTIIEWKLQGMV